MPFLATAIKKVDFMHLNPDAKFHLYLSNSDFYIYFHPVVFHISAKYMPSKKIYEQWVLNFYVVVEVIPV